MPKPIIVFIAIPSAFVNVSPPESIFTVPPASEITYNFTNMILKVKNSN